MGAISRFFVTLSRKTPVFYYTLAAKEVGGLALSYNIS